MRRSMLTLALRVFVFAFFPMITLLGCEDSNSLDEKLAIHKKHLLTHPDDCVVRGQIARIYQERGQLELSIPHFQKIVDLCPDDFTSRYQLGIVLLLLGETQLGLDNMHKAIEEAQVQGKFEHAEVLKLETEEWLERLR